LERLEQAKENRVFAEFEFGENVKRHQKVVGRFCTYGPQKFVGDRVSSYFLEFYSILFLDKVVDPDKTDSDVLIEMLLEADRRSEIITLDDLASDYPLPKFARNATRYSGVELKEIKNIRIIE
jgi:hypothetical protein